MRGLRLAPLIFVLPIWCLPLFSQEPVVVRIGVAALISNADKVSVSEARDRMVKALNQHKPGKKGKVSVEAVSLNEPQGRRAIAEAKEKGCQFVVFSHLTDLQGVDRFEMTTLQGPGDVVRATVARVEYEIRRADGAEYAIGSAQSESMPSTGDAVTQAMEHVAREVASDLEKGMAASYRALNAADKNESGASKITPDVFFLPDFCAWLPANIPHSEALRGACEYAISLPQKMPNFVCEQSTSRYRGESEIPRDLVTAAVRYEDGSESYSDVKLNGKVAPKGISDAPGMWSSGQFGGNLRAIFNLRNDAVFKLAGEGNLGKRSALIFSYQIARQNEPLWRLHGKDGVLAPPYGGELWVDQATGAVLRFRATARDIPRAFPVQKAELITDYDNIEFADGTAFDLPVKATVATKYEGEESMRNVIEFRNCHKFRATTRVMAGLPAGENDSNSVVGAAHPDDLTKQQDEESNTVYAILREQAVREDAARMEREQQQDLQAAANEVVSKLVDLEKSKREKQRREQLQQEASAKVAPSIPAEDLATLKVRVNLVQVSVVLRDGKGRAVGDMLKEDFRLFDDGKPQVITKFSAEKGRAAVGESQQVSGGQPSKSEVKEDASRAAGPRYVAYVFDDIHASFEDLASAAAAAGRHLAALGQGDSAAVFTASGQLGLDFTSDREKLQEALKNLRPHPLVPIGRCPQISDYMADLIVNHDDLEALSVATVDADNCAFGGMKEYRRAEQIAKTTAFEVINTNSTEMQSTLGVLREVVRRTAAMPGSRSIVLISPGFLMLAPETRQGIMGLVDEALQTDIIFHTLDVRGLSTPMPAPNSVHSSQPVLRFRYDREEQASRSDVMADLAYSTGGTFFHNNNDMDEGFRRTADAPEFIYVLGFSPQKLDGKFHKLKVTVSAGGKTKQPKLTVQARQGYYAMKPAGQ